MAESPTAVYAALAGNAAIAVLKGIVALLTGSSAMLAEMFHSAADTGNQALLLLGLRLSKELPDRQHPFGHGMNVYFWAFVVSVMLFTVGGAFSIWEAVRTFLHAEHEGRDFTWAYVVLAGSALFEGTSLVVAVRTMRRHKDPGDSVLRYWRESRDPTTMTVLLEDTAALVSLGVAAGGLYLVQRTGNVHWDGVASAIIGCILLAVAIALAYENHSLLIGETAPPDVVERIRSAVARQPDVERLVFLHTMNRGPESVLLAVGVRVRRDLTAVDVERTVERVHGAIADVLGGRTSRRLILVEPVAGETGC